MRTMAPGGRPEPDAAVAPARWFIALWPDAATCAALQSLQSCWSWPPRARPTCAGRLHLTLHFLGPLPESAIDPLHHVLAGVAASPWHWTLRRASVWPGGIAVVEPVQVPAAARALHVALGEVLRAQGLPLEARPWRPHVTLARRAHGAATPHSFEPVEWTARSFELVCSDRGYRRVARWALAARAGGDAPSARCCGRGSR
ncbi:MAG: RNA 2',3'-cyclic phosphodiesterase [Burkholderiaceae bacterium]|nr:RNA 2',3'-cyclic phosphodiesterase [Burkholderiaceae bacterium]